MTQMNTKLRLGAKMPSHSAPIAGMDASNHPHFLPVMPNPTKDTR